MPDDFDDLLIHDWMWSENFAAALRLLEDFSVGQLALWPVDDFVGARRFVACPQRGTHLKLRACWRCWSDLVWGCARLEDLLAPGGEL